MRMLMTFTPKIAPNIPLTVLPKINVVICSNASKFEQATHISKQITHEHTSRR